MKRLAGVLLVLSACSAAKANEVDRPACERQAEGHYRQCVQPQYFNEGERPELPNSQEIQTCERSYHQALRRCAGYDSEELPQIDLSRTSSAAD